MLLRTIHSIYNRTPRELLHEIILINDNSTMTELYDPLEDYVKQNFDGLVKIFVQKERRGLVLGRLEGARFAKGEVLVGVLTCYASACLICVVVERYFWMRRLKLM